MQEIDQVLSAVGKVVALTTAWPIWAKVAAVVAVAVVAIWIATSLQGEGGIGE